MNKCNHCEAETMNPKFCSKSCAAKHNNKGVRRHGKDPIKCVVCNTETRNKKFCSSKCAGTVRKKDPKLIAASNAARQARYRAKYEAAVFDDDMFVQLPGINDNDDVIPGLTPDSVNAIMLKLKTIELRFLSSAG